MPRFGKFVFGAVNTILMFVLLVSGLLTLGVWGAALLALGASLDNRVLVSAITAHAMAALIATALLWQSASFEKRIEAENRRSAYLRERGHE